MEGLTSIKEAAIRLACSEAMLRKWIYQGRLPYVKMGRLTRLRLSDLEAYLRLGLQPARQPKSQLKRTIST